MIKLGRIILEHFDNCPELSGSKHYEKGHPGIVLEDRLVAAGLTTGIFGEKITRLFVAEELISPCIYQSEHGGPACGYAFARVCDAELVWGEVLEAVD